jgi:hypothetical protein
VSNQASSGEADYGESSDDEFKGGNNGKSS